MMAGYLADVEAGAIVPEDVRLPNVPADASPLMRRLVADLEFLFGVRLAVYERRPLLYSARFGAARLGDVSKSTVFRLLGELVRLGALLDEGPAPGREGRRGTGSYGVPGLPLAMPEGAGSVEAHVGIAPGDDVPGPEPQREAVDLGAVPLAEVGVVPDDAADGTAAGVGGAGERRVGHARNDTPRGLTFASGDKSSSVPPDEALAERALSYFFRMMDRVPPPFRDSRGGLTKGGRQALDAVRAHPGVDADRWRRTVDWRCANRWWDDDRVSAGLMFAETPLAQALAASVTGWGPGQTPPSAAEIMAAEAAQRRAQEARREEREREWERRERERQA